MRTEKLHAIHHANLVFGGCGVGENNTFIFMLLADVATAGEPFKWKTSQTVFASLQEGMGLTSSQTSGLFLSDRNFSTTGSLFSSAAFRNLGTSTGSV